MTMSIDGYSNLNYSEHMDEEINILEAKLNLLVNKIDNLKKENLEMKPNLHRAQEEVLLLKTKINDATIKIENLLAQIPESTI
jgi:predicted  nucleic acid-binding Zn-ribbon protein